MRQPWWPSDTPTTVPVGSGAGKESAARETSVGVRPSSRSRRSSSVEATKVSSDRSAASSCSSTSRSFVRPCAS